MSPFHGNIVTLNNHLWILESSVLIFRLLTPSWDDVHLRFMNISQLFKTSPYSIIFLSVCPDINMFFSDETFFNVSWKPIYLRFLKCFTCVQFPGCSQKYLLHLKHTKRKYLGWRKMVAFLLYFIALWVGPWQKWKSGLPTSGLPPLWTILSTFAIRIAHTNYNINFHFISIDNADIWVIVYLMLGVWISFEYLFECSADVMYLFIFPWMFAWEDELKIAASLFDILSPKNRPELWGSCTAAVNVPIHRYYQTFSRKCARLSHWEQ